MREYIHECPSLVKHHTTYMHAANYPGTLCGMTKGHSACEVRGEGRGER